MKAWMFWSLVQMVVGRVRCFGSSVDCGRYMGESCTAQNHSTCSTSHRGTATCVGSQKFCHCSHWQLHRTDVVLRIQQALHVRGEPPRPGDLSGLPGGHASEGGQGLRFGGNSSNCPPGLHPGPRGRWVFPSWGHDIKANTDTVIAQWWICSAFHYCSGLQMCLRLMISFDQVVPFDKQLTRRATGYMMFMLITGSFIQQN